MATVDRYSAVNILWTKKDNDIYVLMGHHCGGRKTFEYHLDFVENSYVWGPVRGGQETIEGTDLEGEKHELFETPVQAALRETREEMGVRVSQSALVLVDTILAPRVFKGKLITEQQTIFSTYLLPSWWWFEGTRCIQEIGKYVHKDITCRHAVDDPDRPDVHGCPEVDAYRWQRLDTILENPDRWTTRSLVQAFTVFSKTVHNRILLEPNCARYSSQLARYGRKIWELRNHADIETDMDDYGQSWRPDIVKVEGIRSTGSSDEPAWYLGYSGIQGRVPATDMKLNDTAGLSMIMFWYSGERHERGCVYSFHTDEDTVTAFHYTGEPASWNAEVAKARSPHYWPEGANWKDVTARVPRRGTIALEDLFESSTEMMRRNQSRRKSGYELREQYLSEIYQFMEGIIGKYAEEQ